MLKIPYFLIWSTPYIYCKVAFTATVMMETTEARVRLGVAFLVSCTVLAGASASAIVGFPSRRMIEAPSISTQVLPSNNTRQWIFPSMMFNCTGNITRWIFRAEETGNNNERVPRMSTWRSNRFTVPTTDFNRISQSGSAGELTGDGPVYEYALQEPVAVQEGDFLGFDLSPEGDEELQFVFLDLGAGNAPDSYARIVVGSNINIAARFVIRNQQYLPLITAVIGSPDGSSTSVVLPTSTPPPTPTPSQTGFPGSTSTQITSTTQATQTTTHLGTMISATVSATPTQQQSTDVQTGLPMSTIIILSTVVPSTLVLLMLVCTVVVIILIVRWRITRKQVDTAHEHTGSTELNASPPNKVALEHFKMNTNDAYGTNTAEIATTENVAYTTTDIATSENVAYTTVEDTIPATQNVAYGQIPPGTDECYDYVIQ